MSEKEFDRDLFRRVIRELTFVPSITLPELYESTSENKIGRKEYDENHKDSSIYLNENKRHSRLLASLCCENTTESKVSKLVEMPKIYDKHLAFGERRLYNYMAELSDFPPISNSSPSIALLKEACCIDGASPNDEMNAEYYPYFFAGKRTGVTFIEYILLVNISLVTHHRTLSQFQRLLKDSSDKDSVNKWISKVVTSMYLPTLFKTYVDTFFCVCYKMFLNKYNQDRLNIYQLSNTPENDVLGIKNLIQKWEEFSLLDETWEELFGIWKFFNYNDERKNDTNTSEREQKLIGLIKAYIEKAMQEAENILPKLFF